MILWVSVAGGVTEPSVVCVLCWNAVCMTGGVCLCLVHLCMCVVSDRLWHVYACDSYVCTTVFRWGPGREDPSMGKGSCPWKRRCSAKERERRESSSCSPVWSPGGAQLDSTNYSCFYRAARPEGASGWHQTHWLLQTVPEWWSSGTFCHRDKPLCKPDNSHNRTSETIHTTEEVERSRQSWNEAIHWTCSFDRTCIQTVHWVVLVNTTNTVRTNLFTDYAKEQIISLAPFLALQWQQPWTCPQLSQQTHCSKSDH